MAAPYGRYGYQRITELHKVARRCVGTDRVQHIWCREGLKAEICAKVGDGMKG